MGRWKGKTIENLLIEGKEGAGRGETESSESQRSLDLSVSGHRDSINRMDLVM